MPMARRKRQKRSLMGMRSQLGIRLVLCALAVPGLASAQGTISSPAVGISAEEALISAKKHYALQQYSQALPLFRKAANAANGEAARYLGDMYESGQGGLAKDSTQAVSWYRKAADAGDATSMTNLGFMYESGRGGLARDDAEAVSWYRKAADAGDATGMTSLAVLRYAQKVVGDAEAHERAVSTGIVSIQDRLQPYKLL
jgi:TPR repeat protein